MQVRKKRPNVCWTGVQKEKKGRLRKEAMLEDKTGEDIPELMEDLGSHVWKYKKSIRVLLNQTWVLLPQMQQNWPADTGLRWRKV